MVVKVGERSFSVSRVQVVYLVIESDTRWHWTYKCCRKEIQGSLNVLFDSIITKGKVSC